ncbi:ATP synthase subunit g, mitochondrial [Neodiprion pinetum]|uniref:ATP synthase subunit g n=1 Tax=Neodiprion lecontei TaxID=441921 RepID=A0A6J0B9U2_NEOLC|nr:ATP synthase subunit g, mitochondrial [Neodiprion lecontei]XP_046419047.1 ATP synthase subunit g, mitochondrial-like [Neodiprion fabricii]XP_046471929.1 ATP synthase subunit g, mitochondrial-like [Neodiprion pinetum]XP_046609763.1 ATP synthase subunit g, mitochondrial-like [Neodiprion virginianus]
MAAQLPAKAVGLLKTGMVLAKPKLQVFRQYAMVELTPPKLSDIPAIRSGIAKILSSAKNGSYRNLTVREAWLNTLVGIEVLCWFYIGEVIGKRHLVGYKV